MRSLSFTPICYLSDTLRFIWVLVAKNASTTIRNALSGPPYRAAQMALKDVAPETRRSYLTFAFLRDPIDRTLSAYQEVSFRADEDPAYLPDAPFVAMPRRRPTRPERAFVV